MFYSRKIYPEILSHTEKSPVTVLTGMRRTGKTTLVKHLLLDIRTKNSLYLDLQRLDNRELFGQKNYDSIRDAFIARGLLPDSPMVVALDEIQLAPDSPSAIKYLFDHWKIKFVVIGSSSFYLKNLFTESLSGRKKIFELYPLDFGEFLTFKEIPIGRTNWQDEPFNLDEYNRLHNYYEEFVKFGGFPQVVLASSYEEKKDNLADIMSSYINIDIRTLADFSDERALYALAKLLASRTGNRVEYSHLSQLTGLSRPTVTNYVTFFEKTYLVKTIGIISKSIDRRIVKSRKLYFCDTGLANSLADLSSGVQFENTLFNQLVRNGELSYFALKNSREIDFIFPTKLGIEAKETPTQHDMQNLLRIAKVAGLNTVRLVGRYRSPKFTDFSWAGSII